MAKISVWGYEVPSDPGINNFTSYTGAIDVKDVRPGMDIERLITNRWWRESISPKFSQLTLVEMRPDGAFFRYGASDIFVAFGQSKQVDKVGLSYAYAELHVSVEQ